MKNLILLTLLFNISTFSSASLASDCSCSSDPYTKVYATNGIKNTWYGGKRAWSCLYTCENSIGLKSEFRGNHKDWYVGEDDGLWGICEGLVYVNEYNAHAQRFVWAFSRTGSFDPVNSKSPEVKAWAKENCRP